MRRINGASAPMPRRSPRYGVSVRRCCDTADSLLVILLRQRHRARFACARRDVCRIPYVARLSLMSSDFGKLRSIINLLTPGLIYATDGGQFARAIYATVPDEMNSLSPAIRSAIARRRCSQNCLQHKMRLALPLRIARCDTDRQIPLPPRGSTRKSEGCHQHPSDAVLNQAMLGSSFAFVKDEPPVVVDWLPGAIPSAATTISIWCFLRRVALSTTATPLHRACLRHKMYARDRTDHLFQRTQRLRGVDLALPHRRRAAPKLFFSKLKVLFYAGAGLNQTTWEQLTQLAIETTGERIIFLPPLDRPRRHRWRWLVHGTSTDRATSACRRRKRAELLPNEGKLEARLRGPHITPAIGDRTS